MKKGIIIAIVLSALFVAGGYAYLFILTAEPEQPGPPPKVKISVLSIITGKVAPVKAVAPAMGQAAAPAKDIAKQKPAVAAVVQPGMAPSPPAATPPRKEEPKKSAPPAGKSTAPVPVAAPASASAKPAAAAAAKPVAPAPKTPKHYRLEYVAKDSDDARTVKETLIQKGYHTARIIAGKKTDIVIVAPFTDKGEAEFVRDSMIKEASITGVAVRPVY